MDLERALIMGLTAIGVQTPLKDWQKKIVERDQLDAMRLVSAVSGFLYPDLLPATAEAKLMEIPEMARLRSLCAAKVERCKQVLRDYA